MAVSWPSGVPKPGAKIELFYTSCATTLQQKSDTFRLRALLDAKKISYEEVSLRTLSSTVLCV